MKRRIVFTWVLVLILLASATAVGAQTGYWLSRSVIAGGGGGLSAGSYSLNGTISQPGAAVLASGSYRLYGGFWNPQSNSPLNPVKVFLPMVIH